MHFNYVWAIQISAKLREALRHLKEHNTCVKTLFTLPLNMITWLIILIGIFLEVFSVFCFLDGNNLSGHPQTTLCFLNDNYISEFTFNTTQ